MFHAFPFVEFLIGLISIMNPVGNMPLFLGMTDEGERRRVALVTATATAVTLLLVAFAGGRILGFFAIGVPDLRVAGGLIVLLLGISMLHARTSGIQHTEAETSEGREKDSPAIVPLAIPLTAGPGAISTVILFASNASDAWGFAAMSLAILLASGLTYITFLLGVPLQRMLGVSGMNIIVRVMGMLLAAMAVSMIGHGLKGIFPILASTP